MLPLFLTSPVAALILRVAYLIWIVPEVFYSFVYRVSAVPNIKTKDRGSGIIVSAFIFLGVFTAIWFTYVGRAFFIPWQPLVFGLGITLMLASVIFRWYAIRVLGKYFTVRVAVQPGQRVVEAGPYRLIRHPSYTGSLMTMLGLGLVFTNWLSLASVLVAWLIGYSYRVHVEEATLAAELGQPYLDYMKRTKRFIPFLF